MPPLDATSAPAHHEGREHGMIRHLMSLILVSACLFGNPAWQDVPKPAPDPFQLGLVLKHAREYCSRTGVVYRDYKFFTVETLTTIK
jgi:hypothetical protein